MQWTGTLNNVTLGKRTYNILMTVGGGKAQWPEKSHLAAFVGKRGKHKGACLD